MDISLLHRKLEFDRIKDKLINYCYSAPGIEIINNIPFYTAKIMLIREFSKLKSVKEILESGSDLPLEGLKDIRDSLERLRIPGNYIQPEKYLWIKEFLRISRIVKSMINSLYGEENELRILTSSLYQDKLLEHNIDSIIDVNGDVKDTASRDLKKIRASLIEKRDALRKSLSKILNKVSEQEYSQEDIITLRDGRSVIPVKVENKRKVPGIIHSSSSTGYTVFIEPAETIDLNNEITELYFEEKREVETILRYLSEDIAKYYYELKVNSGILGELDFIRAKAKYAIEYNCSEPVISDAEMIYRKAYHPLLLQKFGREEVIPLEFSVKDGINTIIITGPNAGGKTVALKTAGILQMMFQSGMFIPASPDSVLRIFDKIFVVIGDEQSIENSLSSFSSHVKELKEVIDGSDKNSLILIDEICSGTDPKFGSALAASVLKEFSDKGAFTVVTTHIGDLKVFAHNNPKFENASLDFDFERLAPSFKFNLGIPGQSYTFELARKFRVPDRIIDYASSFIAGDHSALEDLLVELNKTKVSLDEQLAAQKKNNSELNEMISEYERKMSVFRNREKEMLKEAKSKAEGIIEEGRKLVEKTVKDVKEKEKSVSDIKKEFKKESEKFRVTEKPAAKDKKNFKIGDLVKVSDSSASGEITAIEGDAVTINANGIILKAKKSLLEQADKKEKDTYAGYSVTLNKSFDTRLDIRGKYSYEIEELLETFVYEGQINSARELTVVHGKGSGSLRKAVHALLKKNKHVSGFRLGNWNEGDTGATIIELKQ